MQSLGTYSAEAAKRKWIIRQNDFLTTSNDMTIPTIQRAAGIVFYRMHGRCRKGDIRVMRRVTRHLDRSNGTAKRKRARQLITRRTHRDNVGLSVRSRNFAHMSTDRHISLCVRFAAPRANIIPHLHMEPFQERKRAPVVVNPRAAIRRHVFRGIFKINVFHGDDCFFLGGGASVQMHC